MAMENEDVRYLPRQNANRGHLHRSGRPPPLSLSTTSSTPIRSPVSPSSHSSPRSPRLPSDFSRGTYLSPSAPTSPLTPRSMHPPRISSDGSNRKWSAKYDEPERRSPGSASRSPLLRNSKSTSRLNAYSKPSNSYSFGDYRSSGSLHHKSGLQPAPPSALSESYGVDAIRSSSNSNCTMTSNSSIEQVSGTERNSVVTKASSITDVSPDNSIGILDDHDDNEGGLSVEDIFDMYSDGFSIAPEQPALLGDANAENSRGRTTERTATPQDTSNQSDQSHSVSTTPVGDSSKEKAPFETPQPKTIVLPGIIPPAFLDGNGDRDRYGFRKANQHITIEVYEKWNRGYSHYLALQKIKWDAFIRESGMTTHNPATFPPKSSKTKRLVRKGIPPEYRGAAWFYYAGGYDLMKQNPGHFEKLVRETMNSSKNDDKEHIERDLHRTFPDNIHFKPDLATANPESGNGGDSGGERGSVVVETPMIQSLRRVLYAFALHNPKVGYTQSLNFIAGMLLLFVPEENAFWMLHIVTSQYLPGTHEISLEGANIDLWTLMVLLRNSSPNVYAKIASSTPRLIRSKPAAPTVRSQLPDVTLGLTNWLMSLFIGSLPLETTLRVWDVLFYEGSKTFFRVSLAIFKACERDILAVSDPMEVFQVIQTNPKKLLDANAVMEECFARKLRVGQSRVEDLRASRRAAMREKENRPVSDEEKRVPFQERIKATRSKSQTRRRDRSVGASIRHMKNHAFDAFG